MTVEFVSRFSLHLSFFTKKRIKVRRRLLLWLFFLLFFDTRVWCWWVESWSNGEGGNMILREHQVMHLEADKKISEENRRGGGMIIERSRRWCHHHHRFFLLQKAALIRVSLPRCISFAIFVLLFIHYFYSLLSSWSWGKNPFILQSRREFSLDPLLDMIIIIKSMKQGNEDVAQFLHSFFSRMPCFLHSF